MAPKPRFGRSNIAARCKDLAGSNTDAAAILARAARLDAWLDDMPEAVSHHASDELHNRIIADMETALAGRASDTGEAGKAGEIVSFPTPAAPPLRAIWVGATALAACLIGGIIMAPLLVESVTGSADLLASSILSVMRFFQPIPYRSTHG